MGGTCRRVSVASAYKCRPSQHVPSELPHTPTLSTGQVVSMATLKVMPAMATVNGTTFTQIILTPLSPQRKQSPTILPKQEVVSSEQSLTGCATEPLLKLEYARQRGGQISKKAMNHPRPQAVTRRNTRERNRVRAVNQGES